MSSTFVFSFGSNKIKTTIATNQEQVDEAVKALMSNNGNYRRLIGLDIITKRDPWTNSSKAMLLQLGDGIQCVIIRLHCFDTLPESLYNFLSVPAFTFSGFGIKNTLSILKKDYGLLCKNTLEVGQSAWYHLRLPATDTLLSMGIPSCSFITDVWEWDAEVDLTGEMIYLAASNAFGAFRLGENLRC